MVFELNQEEIGVLRKIAELEDAHKKTDYHSIVAALQLKDSGKVIPVLSRLDDDGYTRSNGIIYRYFHVTEKGRKKLAE